MARIPWEYPISRDTAKCLVTDMPVVGEAVDIIFGLYTAMSQGFFVEARKRMNPGVFDRYLQRMKAVLDELKVGHSSMPRAEGPGEREAADYAVLLRAAVKDHIVLEDGPGPKYCTVNVQGVEFVTEVDQYGCPTLTPGIRSAIDVAMSGGCVTG